MERAAVRANGSEVGSNLFRSLSARGAETPAASEAEIDSLQLDLAVEQLERKLILRALGAAGDNKAQAARLLGISERTFWYKLKKYRL